MPKGAAKIAARMADDILMHSGTVNKSAGHRQQVIEMVYPAAVMVAALRKATCKQDASFKRLTKVLGERMEQVTPGFVPFTPDEFTLRRVADDMVSRRAKRYNGTAPEWHPEAS